MTKIRALVVALLLAAPSLAFCQGREPSLEATLWDVDQRWLCDGPYQKPYQECVRARSLYWVPSFFEVQSAGTLRNRSEMVASQMAAGPAKGVHPFPADFKLAAVYGNIALGTDHTDFQAPGPDGKLAFTAASHCLRVFVKEQGEWRPAAAALVPIIPPTEVNTSMSGAMGTRSPDPKLEKELADLDEKWMEAVRTAKIDFLKENYTDKWFEILGWAPTVVLTKPAAMQRVAKLNFKPGEGIFPDQFRLMAVYGDVALASDRRIRKIMDSAGNLVSAPHRALLVFVRENNQWKIAADAAVPIMAKE